jgi:sulfide:quinone oxidoreductase
MTESSARPDRDPLRVVIVGGGVAALEAMLALRAMAPSRVAPVLVSASDEFVYRPVFTAEPFGLGDPRRYRLADLCGPLGVEVVINKVTEVLSDRRTVRTDDGHVLDYDALMVATGARPYPAFDSGVTFERELSAEDFDRVLLEVTEGSVPHIVVVVPDGVSWTLPAYEVALLTADWAERRHPDQSCVTLISHEPAPLAQFGATVSAAVRELLLSERIAMRFGVHPDVVTPTALRVGGAWMSTDRIVSLPLLAGPGLAGLPADDDGFIPVDACGRVEGLDGVYAVGDSATFPIKQGGLAAQQADAAASDIANRAGAALQPHPFRPVLRGLLITKQGPRYLRAELDDVDGTSTMSAEPLWWPPSKIASRWLGPHLARLEVEHQSNLTWESRPTK